MKILTQNIITTHTDGTQTTSERVHLYAETGRLIDKNGLPAGLHIELGTGASADDYQEEPGTEQHSIPASLPDIEITETEAEPTDEDYIAAAKILLGEEVEA